VALVPMFPALAIAGEVWLWFRAYVCIGICVWSPTAVDCLQCRSPDEAGVYRILLWMRGLVSSCGGAGRSSYGGVCGYCDAWLPWMLISYIQVQCSRGVGSVALLLMCSICGLIELCVRLGVCWSFTGAEFDWMVLSFW
jgi:hypothetical protein